MIYHFPVESKPHEKIDLLITASVNIYQTKKEYSNSNENFSERKLIKQFGNTLFLREPPLSTKPLFLSNFFMTPFFVRTSKTRTPPLILGGGGNYDV